jgi:hypothetical protein
MIDIGWAYLCGFEKSTLSPVPGSVFFYKYNLCSLITLDKKIATLVVCEN